MKRFSQPKNTKTTPTNKQINKQQDNTLTVSDEKLYVFYHTTNINHILYSSTAFVRSIVKNIITVDSPFSVMSSETLRLNYLSSSRGVVCIQKKLERAQNLAKNETHSFTT